MGIWAEKADPGVNSTISEELEESPRISGFPALGILGLSLRACADRVPRILEAIWVRSPGRLRGWTTLLYQSGARLDGNTPIHLQVNNE